MTDRPEQAADAMTEPALADAVDRWGGDLHDWPTPVAAAARKLLEHSAIAREELALAQQLDALLADLPPLPAAPRLRQRISSRLTKRDPLDQIFEWFSIALWRPVLAAALPLLVGFLIGTGTLPTQEELLAEELGLLVFATDMQAPSIEEIGDEF